ncbi:hypothetical protein [Oricola sp.]|uniref:hypothetical protein n=1 Tax=Oricola sp. TaxID=1979950 RepID=UPI0035183BDC
MKRSRKPRRRWFRDMTTADYILSFIGLCLGTFAALFPWHVYLHPESYGPPRMTFSRDGVIPREEIIAQVPLEEDQPASALSGVGNTSRVGNPPVQVDPVTTGKVDRNTIRKVGIEPQPYPGNGKSFTVLAVDGARALVGDADGVYLVRVDSRLPDDTTAEAFREDDNGWYIVTSGGKILRPN